jgi:hypothetical protein
MASTISFRENADARSPWLRLGVADGRRATEKWWSTVAGAPDRDDGSTLS